MDIINITLIVGLLLAVLGVVCGYKSGLVKGITHLIALVATVLTLALIIMLFGSFRAGSVRNFVITLIVMAILGAVYGIVKFLLKSVKNASKLPIIHFLDSVLGIPIGIMWMGIVYVTLLWLGLHSFLGSVSTIIIDDVNNNNLLAMLCKVIFQK